MDNPRKEFSEWYRSVRMVHSWNPEKLLICTHAFLKIQVVYNSVSREYNGIRHIPSPLRLPVPAREEHEARFNDACKATGKAYKRMEINACRTMREAAISWQLWPNLP